MFTETQEIERIEILKTGHIQVQRADRVFKDGVEIAKSYHRHVVEPGADLMNEHPSVVAHAVAAWTPEKMAHAAILRAQFAEITRQEAEAKAERDAKHQEILAAKALRKQKAVEEEIAAKKATQELMPE
jgi:dephospho-CoA kinase